MVKPQARAGVAVGVMRLDQHHVGDLVRRDDAIVGTAALPRIVHLGEHLHGCPGIAGSAVALNHEIIGDDVRADARLLP